VQFGDIVYATATVVVISVLLFVPMDMIFGSELWLVSRAVSVLIASFITGLILTGKLAEANLSKNVIIKQVLAKAIIRMKSSPHFI